MLFNSMSFIFIFFPIVFLLYIAVKKELRNYLLLAASIIFYLWADPKSIYILFSTILINYIGAIIIDKTRNNKKTALLITIILNLSFLVYFKYFEFIIVNINKILNLDIISGIIIPAGISFYIFQSLTYIVDVYKGKAGVQKDIFKLALYLFLFPKLNAGPIVKYHEIEKQLNEREINCEKISTGIKRFIIGLSKKMIIASTLGNIADKIFIQDPSTLPHHITWLGSIAYTMQLYFDFSGYTDMAIGLGLIFGFKFIENFNYPYISKSITEFWHRWHISLSDWFKEYVYIPLGGNRLGRLITFKNLGIVFILTGIWHGANWTFLLWGIWHGFFIIIEKAINLKEKQQNWQHIWQRALQHIYCIFVFLTGWVIFRSDNISYAVEYIKNMYGFSKVNENLVLYGIGYYIDTLEIIILCIGFICCLPIFRNILNIKNRKQEIFINSYLLILFIISVSQMAANTYNPFIYFKF